MENTEDVSGEKEKKRKEREAFEAYFLQEKAKEEARNKKVITLVIIFGVGVPLLFTILYFVALISFGILDKL
jgi:hypothetical protein